MTQFLRKYNIKSAVPLYSFWLIVCDRTVVWDCFQGDKRGETWQRTQILRQLGGVHRVQIHDGWLLCARYGARWRRQRRIEWRGARLRRLLRRLGRLDGLRLRLHGRLRRRVGLLFARLRVSTLTARLQLLLLQFASRLVAPVERLDFHRCVLFVCDLWRVVPFTCLVVRHRYSSVHRTSLFNRGVSHIANSNGDFKALQLATLYPCAQSSRASNVQIGMISSRTKFERSPSVVNSNIVIRADVKKFPRVQ